MFNLEEVLNKVEKRIFKSKNDFVSEIYNQISINYPKVNCSFKKSFPGSSHCFDIVIKDENKTYTIDVWYKISNIKKADLSVPDHSTAKNETLLEFWKDVSAAEQSSAENGYIVFLTNDYSYWTASTDNAKIKNFEITDGNHPALKELCYIKEHKNGEKPEIQPIKIKSQYEISWKDWLKGTDDNNIDFNFCYFFITVGSKTDSSKIKAVRNLDDLYGLASNLQNAFFRGQIGLRYPLVPGAMRNRKIDDYEYRVFISIIRNNPEEYLRLSNLEKLSKMQHQFIPTRMLDVSSNPLVSLFFALSSINSNDLDEYNLIRAKEDKKAIFKKFVENLDKKTFSDVVKKFGDESSAEKILKHIDSELYKKINNSFESWLFIFNSEVNDIKDFNSDTARFLAAIPAILDDWGQLNLRYYAIMDYMIQLYVPQIIKENGWKDSNEIKEAIRVVLMSSIFDFNPDNELKDSFEKLGIVHRRLKYEDSFELGNSKFRKEYLVQGTDEETDDCPGLIYEGFKFDITEDEYTSMFIFDGHYLSVEMEMLHQKVAEELPAFLRCAYPSSLLNGIFIRPVFNSDRMIAQNGSFMLYGLSKFWNIQRFMKYLLGKKIPLVDVLRILVTNDDSFLKYEDVDCYDVEKLKELINNVFKGDVYMIDPEQKPNLLGALKTYGIDKATLGRSDVTTVYQIDKEENNE